MNPMILYSHCNRVWSAYAWFSHWELIRNGLRNGYTVSCRAFGTNLSTHTTVLISWHGKESARERWKFDFVLSLPTTVEPPMSSLPVGAFHHWNHGNHCAKWEQWKSRPKWWLISSILLDAAGSREKINTYPKKTFYPRLEGVSRLPSFWWRILDSFLKRSSELVGVSYFHTSFGEFV